MMWEDASRRGVAHHRHIPTPGDVAFFDDTYDRDGNGRLGDALTHVAIVESVNRGGTITLVHVGSTGVVRFHMNLRHPSEQHDEDGEPWNDPLRQRTANDPAGTRYLSAQLWHGFASFYKAQSLNRDEATTDRSVPTARGPLATSEPRPRASSK